MASTEEKVADDEKTPQTAEEETFAKGALAALKPEQRTPFAMIPLDVLCIVRGFQNERDRAGATNEAIQTIAAWRDKVDYYNFFEQHIDGDQQFHTMWPEKIYGTDTWGHMIQGLQVGKIDTDSIAKMPEHQLERLQGQKMKAYAVYKEDLMKQSGVQRYKHILMVDLTGVGMGMLAGKKRHTIQKIFGIGSHYYPETMWRIYLINTPMVFRAVWAVVKQFLHPITLNKIKVYKSNAVALEKMTTEEGIPEAALPDWIGGKNPGISSFDYLSKLISTKRKHGS